MGLIILEPVYVSLQGRHRPNQLGIEDDSRIAPLARLIAETKAHGAAVTVQLFHTGGLVSKLSLGVQPDAVAPSPYSHPSGQFVVRELTRAELRDIPRQFALAAERVKKAGADGLELHGAHGYLLAQFVSPRTNRRTDEYGGSLENRMRFCLEVVDAVRRAVGPDFPIFYRFSGSEFVEGGLGLSESVPFALALEAAGVDMIDVSAGVSDTDASRRRIVPDRSLPPGVSIELAGEIRRHVKVPVMTAGRINSPELAESALARGMADLVGMGRALLADPDFPNKAFAGDPDSIFTCCAGMGCLNRIIAGEVVTCTVEDGMARLPPAKRDEVHARHRREALETMQQLHWLKGPLTTTEVD